MTISDKQFDSQFDKVENLVHYPWIGCNYASAPKRVLIMGDSHYTVNDEGEFCPEEYDRCVTDKEYTRGIINCAIEKGSYHVYGYCRYSYPSSVHNVMVNRFLTRHSSG